ncbi:MAG TPA: rod shape-determining protein MreC [Candidatus Omnitrophota bacterium]|nr:rod shape-determining protein MreC [Candidatus Omnitrophota bacterium]
MFARFAFAVLLALALLLNVYQVEKFPPVAFARSLVQITAYPLELISKKTAESTLKASTFLLRAKRMENENQELKERIKKNEAQLLLLESVKSENQTLRSAMSFRGSNPYGFSLLPAEVVSRGGGDLAITINRGEDDGVTAGKTVICKQGLVGKISEVSKFTSIVTLITDPATTISAVLKRTNTFGVVRGGPVMKVDYISENASVEVGEAVSVSSASISFARGLPVGRVCKVERKVEDLFQKIEVEPAVDFSKLDVVFICQ